MQKLLSSRLLALKLDTLGYCIRKESAHQCTHPRYVTPDEPTDIESEELRNSKDAPKDDVKQSSLLSVPTSAARHWTMADWFGDDLGCFWMSLGWSERDATGSPELALPFKISSYGHVF